MRLVLVDKKSEQKDISTFIFKPGEKINWIAGQYLIYSLPHPKQDLKGKQRFFTISSAPHQNFPSITTRIERNPSTFKKTLDSLRIGDVIFAKGPDGDFIIENLSRKYVFIAGGIGITPFISILRQLDFENKKFTATLLYSNKNKQVVFKKEFDKIAKKNLNFKINYIYSPERIDKNLLKKFVDKKTFFYVSGPDPMVDKLEKILRKLGVKDENIKLDYFSGYKKI